MTPEGLIVEYGSLGAICLVAYFLLKQVLTEKTEDRNLYRESVEKFHATINNISLGFEERLKKVEESNERIEESNERIENKIDSLLKEEESNEV